MDVRNFFAFFELMEVTFVARKIQLMLLPFPREKTFETDAKFA